MGGLFSQAAQAQNMTTELYNTLAWRQTTSGASCISVLMQNRWQLQGMGL
jgi:hypothetical protein